MTLSIPPLLPKPVQVTVTLGTPEEYGVKIFADILIPLTLDVVMQKDLKLAKVELSINNVNILKVNAVGEMVMGKVLPDMFKYKVSYALINELWVGGDILIGLNETPTPGQHLVLTALPKFLPQLHFEINLDNTQFAYIFNMHAIDCTGTASCKWTYSYLFKLDLANKVFALIPAVDMKIALMEGTKRVGELHIDVLKGAHVAKIDLGVLEHYVFTSKRSQSNDTGCKIFWTQLSSYECHW